MSVFQNWPAVGKQNVSTAAGHMSDKRREAVANFSKLRTVYSSSLNLADLVTMAKRLGSRRCGGRVGGTRRKLFRIGCRQG